MTTHLGGQDVEGVADAGALLHEQATEGLSPGVLALLRAPRAFALLMHVNQTGRSNVPAWLPLIHLCCNGGMPMPQLNGLSLTGRNESHLRASKPFSHTAKQILIWLAVRTALQGALAAQAATACGGSGAAGCRQLSSAASSPATGCADSSCSGPPGSPPPAAPPLANACSAPLAAGARQQACLSFLTCCHQPAVSAVWS